MSDYEEFQRVEQEGWSDPDRVSGYVSLFAQAADQAIGPLLDAVGATKGQQALDLCCGQGNVSETLVARGCAVTGADFSPAMITIARERVPQATFAEADAQALDFPDGAFDIVVSNFGICHVPDQPRALDEMRRVLKPGGRCAITVWHGPGESASFKAFYDAVQAHGHSDVSAPPGPDFHQFGNRETADRLFSQAGFEDIAHRRVECAWRIDSPDGLFRLYAEATVRAAMLLSSQPPDNLAAIRTAITNTVRDRFAVDGGWLCPAPAALVSARK